MENKNSSRRHFLRELGFVSGAFAAGTLVGAKAQANGSAIAQEDLSCVNCQFTVDESKTLVSGGYIYKYTLNYTYFCVGGASGYGTGSRKLDKTYTQYDVDDGTVDADIEKLKSVLLGGFARSCGCGS